MSQNPIVRPFSCPIEGLIRQIAQAGSKTEAQHGEEAKHEFSEAASISVMFFNGRSILIEQTIQDIRRFAHKAIDHINVVLLPTVVGMVIERQPLTHPEIAGIMASIERRSSHPKANASRRA